MMEGNVKIEIRIDFILQNQESKRSSIQKQAFWMPKLYVSQADVG